MPVLYADISNQKLQESLTSGSYTFGKWTEGDSKKYGFRFFERRGGRNVEVSRIVNACRVSLSLVDERPDHGTWKIKYGNPATPSVENQNLTTALDFDATAAEVLAALKNLTDLASDYASFATDGAVEELNGSWLITGLDGDATLTGTGNQLRPAADIEVYPFERADETWVHEIRLIQTPVAWTNTSERQLPPTPTIVEVEAGSTVDDVELPERQELQISGLFRGVLGVRRTAEGLETGPIPFTGDSREDPVILQNALNTYLLTDDEKEISTSQFTVVNSAKGALISFTGESLIGTDQPLLVAYVISAPEGDVTWTLDLNRPELWASLRSSPDLTPANEREYQLQIEFDLEDEHDDSIDLPTTVYRGPVTVVRDIARDGQATGASFNWAHAHRDDHLPLSLDNVIVGEHSASDSFGDGTATTFLIDHGLASVNIEQVTVYTNTEPARPLVAWTGTGTAPSDAEYTWEVTNEDRVTITMLNGWVSTAPTSDQLYYVITAAGPISTYNAHTHAITDITDLQSTLTAIQARLSALEALAPSGSSSNVLQSTTAKISRWNFARVYEAYPWIDTPIERPSSGGLAETIAALKEAGDYLAFPLLNAQHDAAVADLSTVLSGSTLPAASGYDGAVFTHDGASVITLAFGGGRGVQYLQPGEFVASDGSRWYRVTPYARGTGKTFTATTATDLLTADDNQLIDGRRVRLTTTGTLPAGLSTGTDYYVVNRDGDDFQLATTVGGDAIDITDTGSGTHTITPQDETSYYPTDFEREFFAFGVSNRQLVVRSVLAMNFGLELAVLPPLVRARQRATRVHASLVIETGRFPQATSPATTGLNLSDVTWDPNPVMEQRIVIGETPETHILGYQVTRELVSSVDTLSADAIYYGNAVATAAPDGFPFAVRGRLVRFDVEDDVSDPRGVLLLNGLDRYEGSDAPVSPLGAAIVS